MAVPQTASAAADMPPASALDGPDLANKRAGWRKFPMQMHHPHFKPAVVSNDRIVGPNGKEQWINAPPGEAIRFPPVTVLNEVQEESNIAKGYLPSGDPAAIERLTKAPPPPGYVHHEFPRMLGDGTIDEGPDAPPPPSNYYPLWVKMAGWPDEVVDDLAAHNDLLRKRGVEGPPEPPPAIDPRDAEILELKLQVAQLLELKAMMLAQARQGQAEPPAQVPPAADAAAAETTASIEPLDPVEDSTAIEAIEAAEPPANQQVAAAAEPEKPGVTDEPEQAANKQRKR